MGFCHLPMGKFDKREAFEEAKKIAREFLALNSLPLCPFREHQLDSRGLYERGEILVDLKGTVSPVITPGFSWSFPGYKADITVYGVTAHETGHHVSASLGRAARSAWRLGHRDPRVTSYGRANGEEGLAEAIRVFILNPDLLRVGRPGMWAVLTHFPFGLKPLHDDPWDEVLAFAHDKILIAAKGWMVKR